MSFHAVLMEIGRNKVSREVDCESEQQLLREVGKHLMSRDICIVFDEANIGTVIAGMRSVGKVAIQGDYDPEEFS